MEKKSRALKFLELYGSLDRKPLAKHEPSPSQKSMADYVAPPHQSGNMPNDPSIYKDKDPIDHERVIKSLTQRLGLLNIRGVQVGEVEGDDEGSIFVSFSDDHGNSMEAEFSYDENDQMQVSVGDYENQLGKIAPGAITTAFGKYVNLYEPTFLDKEMMMTLFTQGGLEPTLDRLSVPGKDAFGNRISGV